MTASIHWETEMDKAIELSKKEDKLILLDFFNPG